jgi:hypothetical protein
MNNSKGEQTKQTIPVYLNEDTEHCLNKVIESINEKDKVKFNNFLKAFYIKGLRDIANPKVKSSVRRR